MILSNTKQAILSFSDHHLGLFLFCRVKMNEKRCQAQNKLWTIIFRLLLITCQNNLIYFIIFNSTAIEL